MQPSAQGDFTEMITVMKTCLHVLYIDTLRIRYFFFTTDTYSTRVLDGKQPFLNQLLILCCINPLALELDIYSLAHRLCKM